MPSIRIQFKPTVSTEDIKNLNRVRLTDSTKTTGSRFIPTTTELSLRKTFKDLGIWRVSASYPLNLLGGSLTELLAYNLENPEYPINYEFDCEYYTTLSPKDIVDKLKTLEYIEKCELSKY